jgi:cell division protein ZapA (FtsZ GTPase activity inhibitor)
MKAKRYLFLVVAVIACGLTVTWFSTPIQAVDKTYEVQPQISIPEYMTDAARAIDAYEHLMDRYMQMTERVFVGIDTDVRDVVKRLNSMDSKLTELLTRLTRIENALGIAQPTAAAGNKTTPPPDTPEKHQK